MPPAGIKSALRRQANADAAQPAVTFRVFEQVLLMIVFRIIERQRRRDLGGDDALVARRVHRLLEALQAAFRLGLLLWAQRINRRAVLSADVAALAHALRRIVIFPEYLQQLFVADDLRIEHHAHHFGAAIAL